MTIYAKSNTLLIGAVAGLVVTAAIALFGLATQGHAAFNGSNLGLHWTLPIVVYDYFLLTSTGLAMIAAILLIFTGDRHRVLARRCAWLALAGLAGGVAVLALELGHPLRAIWAIPTSFAFSSPLYWKVLFVIAYIVLLLLLFFRLARHGAGESRGLAIGLLIAALGVTGIAGGVYGAMSMRPFWSSGDVPVAFIVESLLGGLAFAIFFSYLAHGFEQSRLDDSDKRLFTGALPNIFALAIAAHLMFVVARAVIGLYSNAEGMQVWAHIWTSPLFHVELWLGLVLPLVLLLGKGTRDAGHMQALAAFLVMVSLFISRYDYIIGGQMVPMFKGAWAPALLSYTPSLTEWMLLLMAIFLANTINAWGEKYYHLASREQGG